MQGCREHREPSGLRSQHDDAGPLGARRGETTGSPNSSARSITRSTRSAIAVFTVWTPTLAISSSAAANRACATGSGLLTWNLAAALDGGGTSSSGMTGPSAPSMSSVALNPENTGVRCSSARSLRARNPVPHPARAHFWPSRDDVGERPRGIDDPEALGRIDDEQPVADHLPDALEVDQVARAEVDEAHRDRHDRSGELVPQAARRDAPVVGLELHGFEHARARRLPARPRR